MCSMNLWMTSIPVDEKKRPRKEKMLTEATQLDAGGRAKPVLVDWPLVMGGPCCPVGGGRPGLQKPSLSH